MFQIQEEIVIPEEEVFEGIVEAFVSTLPPGMYEKMESDTSEYDLSVYYTPNCACIWNKPDSIDKKCVIIAKNDKIAYVLFSGGSLEDIKMCQIYRLEDLTVTGEKFKFK